MYSVFESRNLIAKKLRIIAVLLYLKMIQESEIFFNCSMVLVSRTGKKESSQKPTWLLLMEGETMSKFNSNAVSGSRQRIKLNQKPILFFPDKDSPITTTSG